DFEGLRAQAIRITELGKHVVQLTYPAGRHAYVLNDCQPVNFIDGAVVGPAINLTQGELLVGLHALISCNSDGIQGVSETDQDELSRLWLETFIDAESGRLRLSLS